MIDPNLLWVLGGTALLGIAASVLGCFAFLRGRSLMGDALAHAALPGVCVAFIVVQWGRERGLWSLESKSLPALLAGAALSGALASSCIGWVTRASRLKDDAVQAIVLSTFFGGGIVLLTRLQRGESGEQAGLDKFLFGQAASLVGSDVRLIAVSALVLCMGCALLFKEWKVLCFDRGFAQAQGWRVTLLDSLLLGAIVLAVVLGLQAVGVVLIAALLVTPPAAARFWTDRLERMIAVAALFGALSGAGGSWLSTLLPRFPTGPLIVLVATGIFAVSIVFAPERGLLSQSIRASRLKKQVARENLLRDVWELQKRGASTSAASLGEKRHIAPAALSATLRDLQRVGLLEEDASTWRLTERGRSEARELVRRHRLWEAFLMYESDLGAARTHRDADAAEHFLPPETVRLIEEYLQKNNLQLEDDDLQAGA
jgi:manganese/zinc/iron transport system permease protein